MLSLPKTGSCGLKPPQSHLMHLQCASSLGPAGKISKRIASSSPPGILSDLCHLLSQRAASAAYVGTFRDSIRATRTKFPREDTPSITREHLYGLEPLDPRLRWGTLINPTRADILAQLQRANNLGYEGLVLRQRDHWIKIKPEETHDVAITGYGAGKGKHQGRLGYVTTTKGAVGAGFTDDERDILWAEAKAERLIGQVIEVSCMQFTPNSQFRHPYFVRMRPDKFSPGEVRFGRPNSN